MNTGVLVSVDSEKNGVIYCRRVFLSVCTRLTLDHDSADISVLDSRSLSGYGHQLLDDGGRLIVTTAKKINSGQRWCVG